PHFSNEVGTGSRSTTTFTFASRSRGVVVMETLLSLDKGNINHQRSCSETLSLRRQKSFKA
ncbi:MAG: hypothetical protein ACOYMP_11245, partial [Nodosilinea sp.]